MTALVALRSIKCGKARFFCAAAGTAAAVGAFTFVFSLAATNSAQAPTLARRASAPWRAWRFERVPPSGPRAADAGAGERTGVFSGTEGGFDAELDVLSLTIDWRPDGHVLQGPPMRAILAAAPASSPWNSAPLAAGAWPDDSETEPQIVCTPGTLRRFGRGSAPPIGSAVKFVGFRGTVTARVVGYLADVALPPGWPSVFANKAARAALSEEPSGRMLLWRDESRARGALAPEEPVTPASDAVVRAFAGDENRRMDYARPLLFAAAVLTALALLVNSLLLSVEANRRQLAVLRTIGMTRWGVVRVVAVESVLAVVAGWAAGGIVSSIALRIYVATDPSAFPVGPEVDWSAVAASLAGALVIGAIAIAFALRPALAVHPVDALAARPRRRRRGMAVAFAFGFGAFVAVETWGASLMRCFVPSPEWPDAIVSLLPGGADPLARPELDELPGVRRISELYPLQLAFDPPVQMRPPGGGGKSGKGEKNTSQKAESDSGAKAASFAPGRLGGGGPMLRNALFLGAEWLPRFKFVEGTWEEASNAVFSGRACVVASMLARAHGLHKGDRLRVSSGGGRGPKTIHEIPIAGVVDLNWHMVTSRGLVRGLNGSPPMTDGPAFVSLDTANSLDPRPFLASVPITHLWVEYDPEFLRENGVFGAGRKVEASIDEALGHPVECTVRLHSRDEIADGTLAHGSDVIGQAARVPFIFLAVLSLGFVAMLAADADACKSELAVLRAIGATRAQLAARLSSGAIRAALRGMAFGIPGGVACGWLFTIKTASIWPGLPHPLVVPWQLVAEGAVGSIAFALAVAVPTGLLLVSRVRRAGIGMAVSDA